MPAYVVGALLEAGYGSIVAYAAGAIVAVAEAIVVNVALTEVGKLLAPKVSGQDAPPQNLTVNATDEFRRIVFGITRCGGVVCFYRTSGSTNQYLWYVIAYAGHQCYAAGDAYLDTRQVPAGDIDGSTGVVSTSTFKNGAASKLSIWTHLGTSAQAVDAQLHSAFPTIFTTDHTLSGICYRVFRLERDDVAWPQGAPQDLTSLISGAMLYDPRQDSTNGGTGSHRRDDPSTWEFAGIGQNAALANRWYLSGGSVTNDTSTRLVKYGLQEVDSRIDDTYVSAAADVSEERLTGAAATPVGSDVRYLCNIELSCGQTRRDSLTELLATLGIGQLVYVHGTWRLYAAAYDAPVHDFDQDDLYGEMEVQDTNSAADRFNQVCGTFIDQTQNFVAATSIFRTQSSYVTQDGGRILPKTVALRGVTNNYQVQRTCEIVNRSGRYMRTVKFRFRRAGMKIANWETFTFSHSRYGWTNRVFRCLERGLEYQQDGGVLCVVTAKQEDSAVYVDLATADYTSGTSVTTAIQDEAPDPPTSLTVAAFGGQTIMFSWTLPSFWQLNGIVELWEYTANTPFASASVIWSGRGNSAVITKDDTTTRYYWVTVKTAGGQRSASYPSGNGIAGAAGLVDTIDMAAAAASDTLFTFSTGVNNFDTTSSSPVTYQLAIIPVTTIGETIGVNFSAQVNYSSAGTITRIKIQLLRDGSAIDVGGLFDDTSGAVMPTHPFTLIGYDTPSAGSHNYTVQITISGTTGAHPVALDIFNYIFGIRQYFR